VIRQGGDYYGRTVNLASRISDNAGEGQVLVDASVVRETKLPDVRFESIGATDLKGIARPVELFETRPDQPRISNSSAPSPELPLDVVAPAVVLE
jgi:class 3 adenylate cyclase